MDVPCINTRSRRKQPLQQAVRMQARRLKQIFTAQENETENNDSRSINRNNNKFNSKTGSFDLIPSAENSVSDVTNIYPAQIDNFLPLDLELAALEGKLLYNSHCY